MELELGWLDEPPPRRAVIELVETVERAPGAELVWELVEPPEFGLPAIRSQTWREDDDRTWFGNTLNMSLRLDYPRGVVAVAAKNHNMQVVLEALASVALPMLAQHDGALVLHASAACLGERGLMLCAPGGSGKSSLMVGLVAAGWRAVSEDQCVIDVAEDGRHRVWPGPNWVRFKHGVPPVEPVTQLRFEAVDKVAWALDGWMAHAPAKLERIVFLEPPGGDEPIWEPLSTAEAVSRLPVHATWLHSQESYASAVLPPVLNLAMRVPAFRFRLPRREGWLADGVARLTAWNNA